MMKRAETGDIMTVRMMMLALLLMAGRPAAADVVFTFNQTGSTPAGAVVASGSVVLSDLAFASGVSIARNHTNLLTDWNALGLLGLNFAVNGLSVSLANLVPPIFPASVPVTTISPC